MRLNKQSVGGALVVLLCWAMSGAHAQGFPEFGVITSITTATQFVMDIKSTPDAKPEREQRTVNVAGVQALAQGGVSATHALERLILGRDVLLQGCKATPLAPGQLTCHVMIDLGRAANPSVNLADMLRSWGLAQTAPGAAAGAAGVAGTSLRNTGNGGASTTDDGPVFKPLVPPTSRHPKS
jgi:hypothetical protein